mgnify:CR=1 FL=1
MITHGPNDPHADTTEFLKRLKKEFSIMYLVQDFMKQTHMSLPEVLNLDSRLTVDCKTGLVGIGSKKTNTTMVVRVAPDMNHTIMAYLGSDVTKRKAAVDKALHKLGSSYRKWLSDLPQQR